jgi:hypothetical protein
VARPRKPKQPKTQRKAVGTPRPTTRGQSGWASSGTRRRVALGIWFVVGCLFVVGGTYSLFGKPVRVKVGANLTSVNRLRLSYGSPSSEHISPICGCWKEQDAETWRGITFAARRLTISRSGTAPLTAYVVTAPWPTTMYSGGPWMALPVKSFGPVMSSFDPVRVLEQFNAQTITTGFPKPIITNVQYAILVTDQPLHIRQFGDTPLGSWIPMGSSTLDILPQLTMFPSSANTVDLKESYQQILTGSPRQTKGAEPQGEQSNAEFPALDLLGKRTVIWSDGPNTSVWLSETSMEIFKKGQNGLAVGLVIDPAFSARITVIPTSRETLARFSEVERHQLLAQPHDWLGVSETGSISLRLERSVEDLQEFDMMTERFKKSDSVNVLVEYPQTGWVVSSGQDFLMYQTKSMGFRYPPSPPSRGFNIFGHMAHLSLEGITGSVVLGSSVVDIPAPSKLDFRNIKNFEATGGMMPLHVRGATDVFNTTLTFSGIAEARLNGEPMPRSADRFSLSLGVAEVIAGIVQAIAAVFGMVKLREYRAIKKTVARFARN